jgi:signal recognition particle subunit SRP54
MLFATAGKFAQMISSFGNKSAFSKSEAENVALDIRNILVESDVPLEYAKTFAENLKQKLLITKIETENKKAIIAHIVKDHIIKTFGGEFQPINVTHKSFTVSLFGPNGVGKTTTLVKIAKILQKQNKSTLCVSLDNYRPAAQQQLKELCNKNGIDYVPLTENNLDANFEILQKIHSSKSYDVILVDTPGLNHNDSEANNIITQITKHIAIDEKIFIIDGTFGQTSVDIIKGFQKNLDFTSSIVTKMDSDQVGGIFFSVKMITDKPIRYITTGEKVTDIAEFYPEKIANRIMGKGDIKQLLNEIRNVADTNTDMNSSIKRIMNDQMNFNDMMTQFNMIKKLGGIGKVASMIPGLSGIMGKVDGNVIKFISKQIAIIQSMTPEERENPELLKNEIERRQRVAKGASATVEDVDMLISKLHETSEMVKKNASKFMKNS